MAEPVVSPRLEERIARLEGVVTELSKRIDDLRSEVTALRSEVTARLSSIEGEMRSQFHLLIGLIIGSWITLLGALLGVLLTR